MIFSPITTGYSYTKNYYIAPKLSFNGQLEDDFFEASAKNDIKGQLRALSSIDFDVTSQEK